MIYVLTCKHDFIEMKMYVGMMQYVGKYVCM